MTGVAVVDCGFAMNPGPPLVPRAASAATRLLGLGACGETEAELRAARQQRCTAAGLTNKVLLDRCVTSPKKMGRQIYWHYQTKFTAEATRRAGETYGRVIGDLADQCREFVKLE